MTRSLTRGQLARKTGIGIEALRFYERKGLIPDPPRSPAGYRLYPETMVVRLNFIRRAKQLGFSLNEIGELLATRVDPRTTRGQVREEVRAKIAEIGSKIRDLERMKGALERLTAACCDAAPAGECAILDALEGRDESFLDG